MTLNYNQKKKIFQDLKLKSGNHSPSISSLSKSIPDLKIDVDACFLSNPYATELFFEYFDNQLVKTGEIKKIIEYYPAQNNSIASTLGKAIDIDHNRIFIANGAIEGIQAVLHNFITGSLAVPIPTFSSYYEYLEGTSVKCFKYKSKKENNYRIDLDDYSRFIRENSINNCLIINPNNPDGNHIDYVDLINFIENHQDLDNIIIDESFVHFSYDSEFKMQSLDRISEKYPNLIIVKSLSKDFGIAGIRAGYLIMKEKFVKELLSNGYLWNSNGLAEYFFKLYSNIEFKSKYDSVRLKYLSETILFYDQLKKIDKIHVIKSKANFFLVEIKNGLTSEELFLQLLFKKNIYVRDCSDKIGLEGNYLRIASRSKIENNLILKALSELL